MSKAFLSHSSKDKSLVEKIAKQLGRNNCHYDRLTFEAGRETILEIFKGLDDTDVFVLFISDAALNSEWVQREITNTKTRLDLNVISRIFPLIIEKHITYDDPRIPDWIKKPYNIQFFKNEVIILKKIQQLLREANLGKYAHLKRVNDLFVGRHELLADFEKKIFNLENVKPSGIIAYSFLNGIGRRTFVKNALIKSRIIDKLYQPVQIPISNRESIEDFIYKLSFVEPRDDIFSYDLSAESIENKVEIAKKILGDFIAAGELVFIIDEGGIILPNTKIVSWFTQIINSREFSDQVSICVISKYKPDIVHLRRNGLVAFQVNEMSKTESQTLFIQFLDRLETPVEKQDIRFFLDFFHGIPAQIISTGKLIDSIGVHDAKKQIEEIEEIDYENSIAILEHLKDDQTCLQLLIAFSKMEIISYELVYKIFGENEQTNRALQRIFDMGLFFNVSSTHEYLKLNSSLATYIDRTGMELAPATSSSLRSVVKEALEKPVDLNAKSDYSEFLITLQDMLSNGKPIPPKYFLPSFVLKAIVEEYYQFRYEVVIKLAIQILENAQRFDKQMIRETRYWLCLGYCRKSDEKFFDEIHSAMDEDLFTQKEYHYLMGFYYRLANRPKKAEEQFLQALSIDDEHSRAKRELVTVYLQLEQFEKALNFAADNFNNAKNNLLHIHAYFTALMHKRPKGQDDIEIIQELLERTKFSRDRRSKEFYDIMTADYIYYVERDIPSSIAALEDIIQINKRNEHAFKSLSRIYKAEGMTVKLHELHKIFDKTRSEGRGN